MIESSIVNWIDLGDSMQSLEIYGKKRWLQIFNFFRILLKHKKISGVFYTILKFFYYLQIILLTLTNVNMINSLNSSDVVAITNTTSPNNTVQITSNNSNSNIGNNTTINTTNSNFDYTVKVLNYVSTSVLFIQEIITDKNKYELAIVLNTIITFISLLCLIFISIAMKMERFFVVFPIKIFNLINILILEYFIGPSIQISLLAFKCTNGSHDLLGVTCFSDSKHLFYLVLSFVNFIYFVGFALTLTIYFYEIGSVTENKFDSRINSNYELYTSISKISMFVFSYFLKFYSNQSESIKIIFELYVLFSCLSYVYYTYNYVLYFEEKINYINIYGWTFASWFTFIIFLKSTLNLNETSIFVICGWIILAFMINIMLQIKEEYLLTEFNILESKSLKDIEHFNLKVFNLISMQSFKHRTLLVGIIRKFEDSLTSNQEMADKYAKLTSNQHLKKKYNSDSALSLLAMIYIIYDHYLEKSNFKIDVLFNFCYFLHNKLKNSTYAVYLLSKIKSTSHKEMFLKYILMEDFKSFMINRLMKSTSKESIKRIQLGSAILFNIYCEIFKNKIYEITCNQIDYYDVLKNSVITQKTTQNFLKLGEEIIQNRKETIRLWERITELNPFNEESLRDLTLYLREVLQDEVFLKNETKKLNSIRSAKFSERNNTYYYLFNLSNSILLVDGYSTFGKVLYYTPNFPALFDFSGKEVLNMTIDDLCPQVIKEFHREIIFIGIQYTNLGVIFSQQRDLLLRGKTGNLHWIKIFIKFVPNLSHGVIYMLDVTKIHEKIYNILLDKDFKISAFTDSFNQNINYGENEGYVLDRSCVNSYLAIIIPQILVDIQYSEKEGFFFSKDNYDLKGTFYNVAPHRFLNEKVEKVLSMIKANGRLIYNNEDEFEENVFDELLREIENKCITKQSVFYKVIPRIFSNGRHRYYKIVLSSDLISFGEDDANSLDGKDTKKQEKNEKTNPRENNINEEQYNFKKGMYAKGPKNQVPNFRENNKRGSRKNVINNIELSNNNALLPSQKLIKIKLNYHASEDENKKLMEDGAINRGEEKINDVGLEMMAKKQADENSFTSNSNISINSIASSNFNKLKNGILEHKEISGIKYMKLLSFFFGVGTIILVILASEDSNNKFTNLNNYILQNLFFNHSKISVSCLYFTTLNLNLIKNKIYENDICNNSPCKEFYTGLLEYCVSDIKSEKQNSNNFFDDFKQILFSQKEISLNIYNITKKNDIMVNVENILNLIISYGLNLESNIDEYINNESSIYDVVAENILEQSYNYIKDDNINGFNETQKQANLQTRYLSPINTILIIEVISFSILIIFFIIFIFRIYMLESFYLRKLIYFKNPPFEFYLKNLEELKKRLRNDAGEEEDKFKNEMENAELANVSDRKANNKFETRRNGTTEESLKTKKNNNNNKRGKKATGKKGESDDEDDDPKNKHSIKKKGGRNNKRKKSRDYRVAKVNIMGKYFLKENIYFFIKIVLIIIFSASYYFVINIIDQTTINNMLEFDYTNNAIEGVYKESFMIYLNLKTELSKYVNYELRKKKAAQSFTNKNMINLNTNNTNSFVVWFDNNAYTDPNTLLNSNYYQMNIPTQIDSPKIGTLLMPLTNTDFTTASSSIIELNNLYNVNACSVLFDSVTQKSHYDLCSMFWSSILLKGMEQSITQMSVVITSVIDDFNSLNLKTKNFTQVIADGSVFDTFEKFIQIYLLDSYKTTVKIFRELTSSNLDNIFSIYKYITIGYIIFGIFLFAFMLIFIYSSKKIFNTFMNFIAILPTIYIIEDVGFYKEILKLENHL